VGPRFLHKTLDDYKVLCKEERERKDKIISYIESIHAGNFPNLLLFGECGLGKTFLASMVVRECNGHYVRAYELKDEFEDAKSFRSEISRKDVFKKYATCPLLVIDEIGRSSSKEEQEFLFHILNDRYENELPTVLVTNMTWSSLKEYFGAAIIDRLCENSMSIYFTGKSYRSAK